ncbi:hypothetical protein M3226_26565 [Neobacillus cucumis]|uniref:hypothetical protein n=1 Tax=Neobacillus cucumis TaxID=1740721 RepID=UPI00203FD3D1|nr:hypothetical protein [Neobacillus cucumis]MCM3729176.1 hypothetical protein [Neobacillus cucumis]
MLDSNNIEDEVKWLHPFYDLEQDCEEMYCAKRFLISAKARNRRIAERQLQLINRNSE